MAEDMVQVTIPRSDAETLATGLIHKHIEWRLRAACQSALAEQPVSVVDPGYEPPPMATPMGSPEQPTCDTCGGDRTIMVEETVGVPGMAYKRVPCPDCGEDT